MRTELRWFTVEAPCVGVPGRHIYGAGPTPGLALRSLSRRAEELWIERGIGSAAPYVLTTRRYNRLWIRHFGSGRNA